MRLKIKNSLSAKVFLWIAGSLFLCSFLIYGSIMFFLPKSYTAVSSEQINAEIDELTETLSETKLENAEHILEEFCRENQAAVTLQGSGEKHQYGALAEAGPNGTEMLSFAQKINFSDTLETYILNITAPVSSDRELINALLKLFPFLLILIFTVSFLGAWICSRLIVRPIIEISSVSKRMAKLELREMGHIEVLSVTEIVKNVCEHLRLLADEKNIILHQQLSGRVQITGNRSLIEKALHNIINNAICHSPAGANIYITLSETELTVKNQGASIPAEDLNKIFTPFYRVEKSHNKLTGGSGLGLYLVKNILEQHNLPYQIENEKNGVCFKITINPQNLDQN